MAANEPEVGLEDEEARKPSKDILIIQDDGFFVHSTGDTYDGGFEIKKKDKQVKMNGIGTYKTNEGDVYMGSWDNDRLGAGEVTINFVDGSTYVGTFKEFCYHGHGKYTYPDKTELACDFEHNCPIGNLKLTDPNGHNWLGKAEHGYAWFHSVNHYYSLLEKPKEVISQKASKETPSKRKPNTAGSVKSKK